MKTKKGQLDFISGSIPKALLVFSGPFILSILVQNLYGVVDLYVVGQFAETADTSAVTIGSQLMTLITQMVIGFATGTTVLVGQYYGAKDKVSLARTVGTSVSLLSILAVVLTAGYLGFHKLLVVLMKTPVEAVQKTEQYLFFCSLGIVFIVGYNLISSILIGLGDSKTPFLFVLVACIINVVLDVILVGVFGMGAQGAAIATTVAQAGSFLFSLVFLRIRGLGFSIKRQDFRFKIAPIAAIARIGGPVALQNVLVSASFLFITAIINVMGGLTASAAVGVVEKLITFLFVPATAMGSAVGAAAAQNLGAQQPERARRCMWWGIGIALVPAICITVYCQFYGQVLTGLLNPDPQVIALGASYLRSYIVDILMVSFVFCLNGYFNSLGKSWFSLAHSLVTTFAVRVPMAYLISRMEGASLNMMGWASPTSTLVSLLLCLLFLHRMKQPEALSEPEALPQAVATDGPHIVITIAREYGSGGREIGEKVAALLGIAFYNRNLIDLTAKRSGLAEKYIKNWEERISSRLIWSSPTGGRSVGASWLGSYYSNADTMFNTQSQIIRELAQSGACVIVGRCADYVLRDMPNCFNVFIYADQKNKMKRLAQAYGIAPEKTGEIAVNTDRGRANYYRHYTGRQWGDPEQYHMMLDSGPLGIDGAAEAIVAAVCRQALPSGEPYETKNGGAL